MPPAGATAITVLVNLVVGCEGGPHAVALRTPRGSVITVVRQMSAA